MTQLSTWLVEYQKIHKSDADIQDQDIFEVKEELVQVGQTFEIYKLLFDGLCKFVHGFQAPLKPSGETRTNEMCAFIKHTHSY